jgi:rubrerythrin
MKIIKKLVELIDEELDDSEKYARLALKYKDEDTAMAEMFYSLSLDEMKHMNTLHNAVVKVVSNIKAEDDPRTEGMKIAYDILHEQAIEKAKNVQILQSMYRE